MRNTWALQDAKARFSELVKHAQIKPQSITVRGEPAVVILSEKAYNALIKPKKSLIDFFRNSPLVGQRLDFSRDKSRNRDVDL